MSGSKRKSDPGKSRAALTDNSPKQRVLAAGEWYIGGDSAWHPDLLQVGDIIEFPVYDDHSKEQGNLIVRVDVKFKEDRHGRAFDATVSPALRTQRTQEGYADGCCPSTRAAAREELYQTQRERDTAIAARPACCCPPTK